ncbi:hypothetical protein S40293_07103 [Stachybotrys chartarum IBT 40293]|nr:hypothetical protein S40293_07103 [Stachybotrys chartarum IBT 40293]
MVGRQAPTTPQMRLVPSCFRRTRKKCWKEYVP